MKAISDIITLFDSIEEYNIYAKKKYTNPLVFENSDPEIIDSFTKENGYIILSILIRKKDLINNEDYTLANNIFKSDDKGFVLGPLNNSRYYLIEKIEKLVLDNGRISFSISNTNFKSFELGLLIDPNFDERGSETMINFLAMLSD